jgi:hypothetical protein
MGGQAQPNAPTQVYYDPEKQQYFSYKRESTGNFLGDMLIGANAPVTVNGQPVSQERMYLANPYTTSVANRIPQGTVSPYPSTDALFPALNAGLLNNLLQGSQPTGAMYGAGKYLTGTNLLSMPTTTTSESKGK